MSTRRMSDEYTSDDIVHEESARQQDVPAVPGHRLRKYNVRMLAASVFLMMALCAILLYRISTLNAAIAEMTAQIGRLTQLAVEQREQIQSLRKELDDAQTPDDPAKEDNVGQGGGGNQEPPAEPDAAHKVYLTFDDGPSPNTQKILDILDKYGVKATFFVVGKQGDAKKEAMNKIVAAGHTLAMHSGTHKYAELYASLEDFAKDFADQQQFIYEATGVMCTIYRFPGGSSNTVSEIDMKDCARYLDSQGVRFFDWNISSGDGGTYLVPVEDLVANCTKKISKNSTSVILMHDAAGKTTTVEALPKIIETIQAMEDTVILPITDATTPIQHITWQKADAESAE